LPLLSTRALTYFFAGKSLAPYEYVKKKIEYRNRVKLTRGDIKQRGSLLHRWNKIIRLIGIVILATGLSINYADLKGWLQDSDKVFFLQWSLESQTGLPLDQTAAKAFMKRFPPPSSEKNGELTHITKQVIRSAGGGLPMMISFNYLRRDGSRTAHVATLYDIREWTVESPYPWIAWTLTLLGFCEVLFTFIIDINVKNKGNEY